MRLGEHSCVLHPVIPTNSQRLNHVGIPPLFGGDQKCVGLTCPRYRTPYYFLANAFFDCVHIGILRLEPSNSPGLSPHYRIIDPIMIDLMLSISCSMGGAGSGFCYHFSTWCRSWPPKNDSSLNNGNGHSDGPPKRRAGVT